MAFLLFISLLVLAVTLIYFYSKRRFALYNHGLPDTKPQILLGNLLNSGVLTGKYTFHEVMRNYQHQYGDKFIYWFGPSPFLAFSLPEDAQTIFTDRHRFEQSPLALPNFDLICPSSITILTGTRWKRHARIMIPVFKRAKVIQHLDTITECADRFIDRYLKKNEIHTNLVDQCEALTMNIIGFIGFDYDLDNDTHSQSRKALQEFLTYVAKLMFMAWTPRWMIKIYLKLNGHFQQVHRQLRELMEKIVEQEQNNQDTTEKQRPKNLIASLVSSINEQANDEQISSGLTRSEMFDEVLTAIITGTETTSTALAWFIFFMSKNPHIQQRIKEELRQHDLLMTDDVQCLPSLTQEKLDLLTYCECVIKEVLRLAPVSSVTTRMALCDTIVNNIPIRRGQTVIINLQTIAIDPRYWHHGDPTQFLPERFLAEDKDHHPYAFVPFGGGHRACLGQDLAWLELKVIMVRLMQRGITFEDTPENTGGYAERITCFPKNMAVRVRMDRNRD